MWAQIHLQYPRNFLPYWKGYQEKARALMLSFRVAPNAKAKND